MLRYSNRFKKIDSETFLFYYCDKIITIEQNLEIVRKYLNFLQLFSLEYTKENNKYTQWLYYLETIFIHIEFLKSINKKDRLYNTNKLIELISKKAADININLIDILNKEIKSTLLFFEEYNYELEYNRNILEIIKKRIIKP